jgi:uncharacterized protein YndB with AHSA1/START domain
MKVSTIIDRPPNVVWQFYAVDHLRNHPRWDPKMELWQLTDGPIGVGTRFRRRHTRLDTPIEGTMEVVEFEPHRSMGGVIHDDTPAGLLEVRSRMTVEPHGEGSSLLTVEVELPGREASMEPSMVEASLARMKELIEGET